MTLISKVVLHHFPASRSVRARWALLETLGENFELKRVELYDGAQYSDDFLGMNPNHNVPLLEIHWQDGTTQVMLESAAIVEWLADRHPEKRIAPPADGGRERVDYLHMLHFAGTWFDMMLWQIRIHEHILPVSERDPRTVARYRKKVTKEVEPQLLGRLDRHDHICGEHFTAADIVVGHCVFWARGYDLCQDDRFTTYLRRLMQREAMKQALDDIDTFTIAPGSDQKLDMSFTG